jgi:hypothetical protein
MYPKADIRGRQVALLSGQRRVSSVEGRPAKQGQGKFELSASGECTAGGLGDL